MSNFADFKYKVICAAQKHNIKNVRYEGVVFSAGYFCGNKLVSQKKRPKLYTLQLIEAWVSYFFTVSI